MTRLHRFYKRKLNAADDEITWVPAGPPGNHKTVDVNGIAVDEMIAPIVRWMHANNIGTLDSCQGGGGYRDSQISIETDDLPKFMALIGTKPAWMSITHDRSKHRSKWTYIRFRYHKIRAFCDLIGVPFPTRSDQDTDKTSAVNVVDEALDDSIQLSQTTTMPAGEESQDNSVMHPEDTQKNASSDITSEPSFLDYGLSAWSKRQSKHRCYYVLNGNQPCHKITLTIDISKHKALAYLAVDVGSIGNLRHGAVTIASDADVLSDFDASAIQYADYDDVACIFLGRLCESGGAEQRLNEMIVDVHNKYCRHNVNASVEGRQMMLAIYPDEEAALEIADAFSDFNVDPNSLHVTVVYLGDGLSDADVDTIKQVVPDICAKHGALECKLQGLGLFDHDSDGGRPFYASVDAIGLAALRSEIAQVLVDAGVDVPSDYDFTPHMTIAYTDPESVVVSDGSPGTEWISDSIELVVDDKHIESFKLGASIKISQVIQEDRLQSLNNDGENLQEDPDLKLGEVEEPYGSGDGPMGVGFDEPGLNIQKDASDGVPHVEQERTYTCGVAAVSSILRWAGIDKSEDELIDELGTNKDDGTLPALIVHVLTQYGLDAEPRHGMTISDLHECVNAGSPIIVAIQSGDDPASTSDGHYVVVDGYEDDKIGVVDPAIESDGRVIPSDDFVARWHDMDANGDDFICFGIIVSLPDEQLEHDAVALPDDSVNENEAGPGYERQDLSMHANSELKCGRCGRDDRDMRGNLCDICAFGKDASCYKS